MGVLPIGGGGRNSLSSLGIAGATTGLAPTGGGGGSWAQLKISGTVKAMIKIARMAAICSFIIEAQAEPLFFLDRILMTLGL